MISSTEEALILESVEKYLKVKAQVQVKDDEINRLQDHIMDLSEQIIELRVKLEGYQ